MGGQSGRRWPGMCEVQRTPWIIQAQRHVRCHAPGWGWGVLNRSRLLIEVIDAQIDFSICTIPQTLTSQLQTLRLPRNDSVCLQYYLFICLLLNAAHIWQVPADQGLNWSFKVTTQLINMQCVQIKGFIKSLIVFYYLQFFHCFNSKNKNITTASVSFVFAI